MTDRPPKLFIPGPTEVRPEVLAACARPIIGHRTGECAALVGRITARLRTLLSASGPVLLLSASANGAMEASLRNLCAKRALCLVSGSWGERFADIARALGLPMDTLEVPPGTAVRPEQVTAALAAADYDCVTLVHNDTSTGVVCPAREITAAVKAHTPGAMVVIDAVSSMAAEPIDVDAWGADVCLAGIQKAFACPPGMSVMALSEAALARAATVPNRGLYFDFVRLAKSAAKDQTLSTPVLSVLYALDVQLERILAEGMTARYARHLEMAEAVRAWGADRFALFAEAGYRSVTLTTLENTRGIDVADLITRLRDRHGAIIGNGYGPLKQRTLRIGHMGDLTPAEIRELLGWLDGLL